MKTIKLPITLSEEIKNIILDLQRQQNNVIKYTYNRIKDNEKITQKELTKLVNSMNNITIGSWLKQSAITKAKYIFKSNKESNIIFGGKYLFLQRIKNKISKEEFKQKRLLPLYIEGETLQKGNRLFKLNIIENNSMIFKASRNFHIHIQLPKLKKNIKSELYTLQELSELKQICYTIALTTDYICITFDEAKLYSIITRNFIKNRIIALDLNPNYIGYSVIDWKDNDIHKVVTSGVINIKQINDKEFSFKKERLDSSHPKRIKINNQRKHEICEIANYLIKLAIHFKCEVFAIEDLVMESKDSKNGKKSNKLVNNNWNRNLLYNVVKKRCNIHKINFVTIKPDYSSFIGNLVYSDYPDMVAASIEINRRAYQFYHQYIVRDFSTSKNIIFPEFSWKIIKKPLEGFFNEDTRKYSSWIDLYKYVKKSKVRYRFSFSDYLQQCTEKVFQTKTIKYKVVFYTIL